MITKTTLHLTFLPDHTTVGMNSDLQLHIQYKYLGFKTSLFMLFYTVVIYSQRKMYVIKLTVTSITMYPFAITQQNLLRSLLQFGF